MENPITLEEERKVWTIHQSVNGITYYYNRSTRKSQYEMPECFKITEEDLEHPDWKEYRTAEGRKFYYNALTRKSCWHMPAEVKEWKMKIEEQKRREREERGEDRSEEKLTEAEEIRRKFMALLKGKPININTKWDACIKICEDDDRWNLLRMAEKKKYFNEYIAELKKVSELEKKAKVEANKILFIKMLKENKKLTSDCKMHKIQFDFITDPRWRMLEGNDKENAYQDYMDELLVKEKEEARVSRDKHMENLTLLMDEQEVPYSTKWDDFRSMFRNNECYKNLHPLDRINTFTAYIIEAEKKHEEEEARQKKLKEKTTRVEFRKLVKDKLMAGVISYKTKWREFCKECRNEEALLEMFDPNQHGTSAHEIFEVLMFSIREHHKTFKSEIKQHFKARNFKMTEETTYSEFFQQLRDLPLYADARPLLQEYFYNYFQLKIKSKHQAKLEKEKEKEKEKLNALKKAQKKERKAIFRIFKLIREQTKTKYNISEHISFIESSLKEQNIAITHESIFKYYLAYLESEGDEKMRRSSRSSSSSRSAEKKKKKRKETSNHKESRFDNEEPLSKPKALIMPDLKPKHQPDLEMEEEGEIKDDELEPAPIAPPAKEARSKSSSSSRSRDKRKKKHKKKKNKNSSSDSE